MGESIVGNLIPEWSDLDADALHQSVKSLEVSF